MSPHRQPNTKLNPQELELLRSVIWKRKPQLMGLVNEIGKVPLSDSQCNLLRDILVDELMETGLQTNDEPNKRGFLLEDLSDRVASLVAFPAVLRGLSDGRLHTLAAERGEHTLVVVFKTEAPWQEVLAALEPFHSRVKGARDWLFPQIRSVVRVGPQGHLGYRFVFRRQSTAEERATVKRLLETSPWVLGAFENTPTEAITPEQLSLKLPLH